MDVHVKLFIGDLLRATLDSGVFMVGTPLLLFKRCSAHGVVVSTCTTSSTATESNADGTDVEAFDLDDGTGVIRVHLPLALRHSREAPRVGELVCALGELSVSDNSRRCIQCTAFEIKVDARYEAFRVLETIKLYATAYFPPPAEVLHIGAVFRPPPPKVTTASATRSLLHMPMATPIAAAASASAKIPMSRPPTAPPQHTVATTPSAPRPQQHSSAAARQFAPSSSTSSHIAPALAAAAPSRFTPQHPPAPSPFTATRAPSPPTATTANQTGAKRSFSAANSPAPPAVVVALPTSSADIADLRTRWALVAAVTQAIDASGSLVPDIVARVASVQPGADAAAVSAALEELIGDTLVYQDPAGSGKYFRL